MRSAAPDLFPELSVRAKFCLEEVAAAKFSDKGSVLVFLMRSAAPNDIALFSSKCCPHKESPVTLCTPGRKVVEGVFNLDIKVLKFMYRSNTLKIAQLPISAYLF